MDFHDGWTEIVVIFSVRVRHGRPNKERRNEIYGDATKPRRHPKFGGAQQVRLLIVFLVWVL